MTFPSKTIYLAGPITGLTHDEARYGWRAQFKRLLLEAGLSHIYCSSPMRGKEILQDFGVLTSGKGYPEAAITSPAGIVTRDKNDVITSDAMVACFLESNGKLSGGTFIEYGWADAFNKPIIGIGSESDPNLAHLMAQRLIGYRVDTLEEGVSIIGHLLTPGI